MRSNKKEEIFVPSHGMVSYDEKGHKVVKAKIIRPITDPAWNAKQAGKRVRMSKKERLKQRELFRRAIEAKKAEASV